MLIKNIMETKRIVPLILGVIMALLGLLWFLQGSDLVHINPILCFADCTPITGKSTSWQIAGGIVFIIGAVITGKSFEKKEK